MDFAGHFKGWLKMLCWDVLNALQYCNAASVMVFGNFIG